MEGSSLIIVAFLVLITIIIIAGIVYSFRELKNDTPSNKSLNLSGEDCDCSGETCCSGTTVSGDTSGLTSEDCGCTGETCCSGTTVTGETTGITDSEITFTSGETTSNAPLDQIISTPKKLSRTKIRKMKEKDLVEYANEIGIKCKEKDLKKDTLIKVFKKLGYKIK